MPKNGISYQVQVEVPTPQMNSPAQLETVSLAEVNPELNLMIRDVARVGQGTMPGEIDRTSSQRYVSITANVEGEDLGRAARQIEQAIAAAGQPPRGRPRPDARPGGAHERNVRALWRSAWLSRWW